MGDLTCMWGRDCFGALVMYLSGLLWWLLGRGCCPTAVPNRCGHGVQARDGTSRWFGVTLKFVTNQSHRVPFSDI